MIGYIFIALLVLLLTWTLFGPVMLQVNTERGLYRFSLPGVFSARIISRGEKYYLRVWIFFIPLRIDPFKAGGRISSPDKKEKKEKKRKGRISLSRMWQKVKRAIRIRRLELDLDTDDFPLNAQLVPVFSALSGRNTDLRVNFEGRLFLRLDLRTRIAAILWMYLSK
ncbi:MAG: hypothetical protein ACOYXB_11920 [Bacteroidota bacterium]